MTVLAATQPPEAEGRDRDAVRLLVAHRATGAIEHARFRDLPDFLAPGDLLVVNTSGTLPAAVPARRANGESVQLRVSTPAPPGDGGDDRWIVELRSADGSRPHGGAHARERVDVPNGTATLVAPYRGDRLHVAEFDLEESLPAWLARHGRPIRYDYVPREWPLAAYQTAFATEPGSAEMPSAARPFTPALVTRLVSAGVLIAPIVLHTGVSSPERHETPYPERFRVPGTTARLVDSVRLWGGRVIAVGTTVVRALETRAPAGWTELVVTPERGLTQVDGLITGWHEPEASHLQLLEAAAGRELLERSYAEAEAHGYRWHEFGDSHLILP